MSELKDKVLEVLKTDKDIDAFDERGYTLLHQAAYKGDVETVQLLLNKGAEYKKGCNGETPLMRCAYGSGSVEIARLLTRGREDWLYDTDLNGTTPLIVAAGYGKIDLVKYFVQKGMPVDLTDADGDTALGLAVDSAEHDVVKYLLEKGANVDVLSRWGSCLFARPIMDRDMKMVDILLDGGVSPNGPRVCSRLVCPPLITAVCSGAFEIANRLVKAGADVNAVDPNDGTSVLFETIKISQSANESDKQKAYSFMNTLIYKGADVSVIEQFQYELLDAFVRNKKIA